MDFTTIFSTVWGWIIAALGGVSLTGLISAIIYISLKGAFNRTIEKQNLKKTQEDAAEQAAEKAVAKIKNISFKQSLQPVIVGQLKLITAETQEMVKQELKEVKEQYNNVVHILEALAKYFDNSIGVSEEAKENLKNAIYQAKEQKVDESIEEEVTLTQEEVEEIIEEPKKSSSVRVER